MKIDSMSRLDVDVSTHPGFVGLNTDWVLVLEDGWWVVVSRGFWCDGASIPAFARPWLHPLVLLAMGVAHDYAVRPGARLEHVRYKAELFSPKSATALANALAKHAGIGHFKRWVISTALRVALRSYWHKRKMDWAPVERARND
jgi:hypothetical protein